MPVSSSTSNMATFLHSTFRSPTPCCTLLSTWERDTFCLCSVVVPKPGSPPHTACPDISLNSASHLVAPRTAPLDPADLALPPRPSYTSPALDPSLASLAVAPAPPFDNSTRPALATAAGIDNQPAGKTAPPPNRSASPHGDSSNTRTSRA